MIAAMDATFACIRPEQPVYAVVPAAGQGTRLGGRSNKPFIDLQGMPVIIRTLRTLSACPCITGLIVVARQDEIPAMQALLDKWHIDRMLAVVPGGVARQDSVFAGIRTVADYHRIHSEVKGSDPLVAIHDGARCLVSRSVICRSIRHAADQAPCAAAVPVKDTIKVADENGHVQQTLDRSVLYAIQTPQVAFLSTLLDAFSQSEKSGFTATDDLSVLETAGIPVDLVAGDETNIKLTTPYDLMIAQAMLESGRLDEQDTDQDAACRNRAGLSRAAGSHDTDHRDPFTAADSR